MSNNLGIKKPTRVGFARTKFGAILTGSGLAFTFLPLAIAFLSTPPGGNMWSEGGGGGGAAIWGMILTLPIGATISIIGIVFICGGIGQTFRIDTKQMLEDPELQTKLQKQKSISMLVLAVAAMLVQPIITFVLANMIIGPQAAGIILVATGALIVAALIGSLRFAIQAKSSTFRILMIVLCIILLVTAGAETYGLYNTFNDLNNV